MTGKRQLVQLDVQRVVACLSVVTLIGQASVDVQRPSCVVRVFPLYGSVLLQRHAGAVVLQVLFGSRLRQIAEAVGARVEEEIVILSAAYEVAVGPHGKHVYAVRRHVAAVACLRLEGLEVVPVVATQAVPRSKPHQPLLVLQHLGDVT